MPKKPKSHKYKGVSYREDDGMFYVEIGGDVLEFDNKTSVKRAITRSLKDTPPEEPKEAEEPPEEEPTEEPKEVASTKPRGRKPGIATVINLPMKESGRKEGYSNDILFVDGEAKVPRKRALEMCKTWPRSFALKGKK